MADNPLTVAGLTERREELAKVSAALEHDIAGLGFRRATVQGALLEIDRLLKLLAEAHGHTG